MAYYSRSSHVGSCLSIVDILYVLYFKVMRIDPNEPDMYDRDKLILSKGHASAALYAVLAERGFFPEEYLSKYYINNGLLPGHLDKEKVPGIETSAGSLGHGLGIGIGMAAANLRSGNKGRIYVIVGDGECNEGSIWEGIMLAAHLKLSNLTLIIDYNKLQGFGETGKIIKMNNISEMLTAFGWKAVDIDGHDLTSIEKGLRMVNELPVAVIAHTVKGKGVSFMENKLDWHYKSPNEKEFDQALQELGENL